MSQFILDLEVFEEVSYSLLIKKIIVSSHFISDYLKLKLILVLLTARPLEIISYTCSVNPRYSNNRYSQKKMLTCIISCIFMLKCNYKRLL